MNFPEFSSPDEGLRKKLEKTEYDTRTYLFLVLKSPLSDAYGDLKKIKKKTYKT